MINYNISTDAGKEFLVSYWTNNYDARNEMLKYTRFRECAVIPPKYKSKMVVDGETVRTIRNINLCNSKGFDILLTYLRKTLNINVNFYYNMAKYEKIPLYLTKEQKDEWKLNHWQNMTQFDLLIDIDTNNSIKASQESTIMVSEWLTRHRLPHEIRFSGKGFHLMVSYYYFIYYKKHFNPTMPDNIYDLYHTLAKYLHDNVSELVDYNIQDSRRVCKIPYSLAVYKDKVYVCTPILSKDELTNFDPKSYTPENMAGKVKNRGTYFFGTSKNDVDYAKLTREVFKNGESGR